MKSDKTLIMENDEKVRRAGIHADWNLGSVFIFLGNFDDDFVVDYYWQENCVITDNRVKNTRKVIRGVFTKKDAEEIAKKEYREFQNSKGLL